MSKELQVVVAGSVGTGKTTVAVLIANYLRTLGFTGVTVELTDQEMPPCPTEIRKRTAALVDRGTKLTVVERQTPRSK